MLSTGFSIPDLSYTSFSSGSEPFVKLYEEHVIRDSQKNNHLYNTTTQKQQQQPKNNNEKNHHQQQQLVNSKSYHTLYRESNEDISRSHGLLAHRDWNKYGIILKLIYFIFLNYNFNLTLFASEFQSTLRETDPIKKYTKLSRLSKDFIYASKLYAKV